MPAKLTIECPGCARAFETRDSASLLTPRGADTAAVELNLLQQSATACPGCGERIELGLLVLDEDGLWRVSRFAGHADDVTVIGAPGGSVSYSLPPRTAPVAPSGLSASARAARERALAVIDGRTRRVSGSAQREALELALEAGVLDEREAQAARSWLRARAPWGA